MCKEEAEQRMLSLRGATDKFMDKVEAACFEKPRTFIFEHSPFLHLHT